MTIQSVLASWKVLPATQRWMVVLLACGLILAQVDQPYPQEAALQHIPTVFVIVLAPWLLGRWPLSDGAVTCILAFLLLHTLGGRYTYSNVPYDDWSRWLTGYSITDTFGFRRNHYDRLVHLSFGLLAIAPVREALMRHAGIGPRMALYVAIEFVLAVSCLYEIFEWLLTIVAAGPMADDYNGQQGDMWDTQKDMAFAVGGALISAAWQYSRGE